MVLFFLPIHIFFIPQSMAVFVSSVLARVSSLDFFWYRKYQFFTHVGIETSIPNKNVIFLQKYVRDELGKELNVNLDCLTRWSSLYIMLERFLKLFNCLGKALIDLDSKFKLTDEDFDRITEIVNCLQPVKLAIEALGRRNATLITTSTTIPKNTAWFALTGEQYTVPNQKANFST
jgi:hypothetical protein